MGRAGRRGGEEGRTLHSSVIIIMIMERREAFADGALERERERERETERQRDCVQVMGAQGC